MLLWKRVKTGESIETSDVVDVLAKKLVDTTDDNTEQERFYRRIQMAIIKPRGATIEWLKRRNPNMLEILHDTLDELAIETDLWVMRSMNQEGC